MRVRRIFAAPHLYPNDSARHRPSRVGMGGLRHKLRHKNAVGNPVECCVSPRQITTVGEQKTGSVLSYQQNAAKSHDSRPPLHSEHDIRSRFVTQSEHLNFPFEVGVIGCAWVPTTKFRIS